MVSLVNLLMTPKGFAFETWWVRHTGFSILNHLFAWREGFQPRPALLLRVKGRKTGKWFQVPLPYFKVNDELMVVGSKGGGPEDPQWAKNLKANMDAEIYLRRRKRNIAVRIAEGDEYDSLWGRVIEEVPTYIEYKKRCEGIRQIPLVLLNPR